MAACGDGDALTGEVQFQVVGAHALRTQGGQDQPALVQVFLTDTDVPCEDLRTYIAGLTDATPGPPPFKQAVILEWFDVGNPSYPISSPFETASPTQSLALWLVGEGGGAFAVSGHVDVSGATGGKETGQFDTLTLDAYDYDYEQLVDQGGFIDDGETHAGRTVVSWRRFDSRVDSMRMTVRSHAAPESRGMNPA